MHAACRAACAWGDTPVPEKLEAARKGSERLETFLRETARKPLHLPSDASAGPAAAPLAAAEPAPSAPPSAPVAVSDEAAAEGAGAPATAPAAEREAAAEEGHGSSSARGSASHHSGGASSASLEQLLFRPVQRMCLYPLLFKQALAASIKVERWRTEATTDSAPPPPPSPSATAEGGLSDRAYSTLSARSATLPSRSASTPQRGVISYAKQSVQEELEQVFNVIQLTLGSVNEDVRDNEARFHTMRVLTSEVHGGAAFITPNRVLKVRPSPSRSSAPTHALQLCAHAHGLLPPHPRTP